MNLRGNALLIALLVTLSTFGGLPIETAATPVAATPPTDVDSLDNGLGDHSEFQLGDADANLQSGSTYWQGWTLGIDASEVIEGDNRAIEVWRVTTDGQLNQRVTTVTVAENGSVAIGTDSLNGRFVLLYDGQPVYFFEGEGYLSSPPDGTSVTVESSAFSVTEQTINAEWSDPEIFPGQATTLSIGSNRNQFTVAASGTGLSYHNLTTIFPKSAYASNHDARASNDQLLLDLASEEALQLNTTVLEPGSQRLTIEPVDTTARTRLTLTVKQPASDRRFVSVESREQVGDVINAELACGSCFVVVGSPEQNVLDIVAIQDKNGDNRINLRINTRYVGQYSGYPGYPSNVNPYTAPNANIRRYGPGTTLEQIDEELSYSVNSLGQLRNQFGLPTNGLDHPIEAGRLKLTVAGTDFLIDRSAWGDRPPFGSELVIRDETDARTVELQTRSLAAVHPMAAPGGSGFESTAETLRTGTSPRDQLALGDRLVFRVEVSGLYGYLHSHGTSLGSLRNNQAEGIDMSLVRLRDGSDVDIRIEQLNVRLVSVPESDSLYLVLRTGADHVGYLPAGRYRLTVNLEGVSTQYDDYSTQNGFEGYPYLPPGAEESVSGTVSIEPPEASILAPSEGESPRMTATGRLELRGTATVAAGTSVRILVESTEFAWQLGTSATVNQTGFWTAAPDLTEAPGNEFDIAVSYGGQLLAESTLTVRPPLEDASAGTPGQGDNGEGDASDNSDSEQPNVVEDDSIVPGIPNLVLLGGVFFALVVITILLRL